MKRKKLGRPKEVKGKLVSCTMELTFNQRRFLDTLASSKACSRSELIRRLVDREMVACQLIGDMSESLDSPLQEAAVSE